MQLTKEQILYIEDYIKGFDIKYYEIYMEILDHMILSVETILEQNKEIIFEDAVIQAKVEGFGKKGFRGMMNEKVKLAKKQARNENNKKIKEYFTLPKLVLTIGVFVVYYFFLSFFQEPNKFFVSTSGTLVFIGIFQLFYFWKFRKFNKLYILKTQMLNVVFSLSFAVFQLSNSFLVLGKETIDFNHILSRLFMTLVFTFSLISILVYIEVRKKTIEELKTQIFV